MNLYDIDRELLYYHLKEAVCEEIYNGRDICEGRLFNEEETVQYKVEFVLNSLEKQRLLPKGYRMYYLSNEELYEELNEMYNDCICEVEWEKDREDEFKIWVEGLDKYDIEMLIRYLSGKKVDSWWNGGKLINMVCNFPELSEFKATSNFVKVNIMEEVLKNKR